MSAVAIAKKNLLKKGFLDIEVDPTLDLFEEIEKLKKDCLLYTSPSPRDRTRYRMPSSS